MTELARPALRARSFLRKAIGPAVLFISIVVFYWPSHRFGFIYDDHKLIVSQPVPRAVWEIVSVFAERHWSNLPYYRPVARMTMVAQKAVHGDDPAPYHLFNVLLMGATAVLVFALFRWPPLAVQTPVALLGAALFAAHPVASSVVYPVCSGRESLLPTLFTVAAVGAFVRRGRRWYWGALALFYLALLSKEQAVIVPGLFVLADVLGISSERRPRTAREWMRRYTPVAGVLLLYFLVRWLLFSGTEEHRWAIVDSPAGPLLSLAYAVQVALTPFIELVYEPPTEVWLSAPRLAVCGVILAAAAIWSWRVWSEVGPQTLFWLGWMLLALLPTANLLRQEAAFAERYVFLTLAGAVGLGGTLACAAWHRPAMRQVVPVGVLLLLGACAAISFHRGRYFRDDWHFHSQWVRTNPESAQAHRSLGWVLLDHGRLSEAETHLREALRLNPRSAEALNNLGNVRLQRGEFAEAAAFYRQAIRLDGNLAEAHNNLAMALARQGNLTAAGKSYQQALEIRPDYSEAHNGLGVVRAMQGDPVAAKTHFGHAIRIDPENAEAHNNLGNVLASEGRLADALRHFERAVSLKPGYTVARENLERMRAALSRGDLK